jgi:hypothetical protein
MNFTFSAQSAKETFLDCSSFIDDGESSKMLLLRHFDCQSEVKLVDLNMFKIPLMLISSSHIESYRHKIQHMKDVIVADGKSVMYHYHSWNKRTAKYVDMEVDCPEFTGYEGAYRTVEEWNNFPSSIEVEESLFLNGIDDETVEWFSPVYDYGKGELEISMLDHGELIKDDDFDWIWRFYLESKIKRLL